MLKNLIVIVSLACFIHCSLAAEAVSTIQTPDDKRESPWLFVPLVSSDPKLGTSGGALAAYLHRFDSKSTVSMFGIMGLYTTTHSKVGGLFARTFFGEDRHRLFALAGAGTIKNDYHDFLGTGYPVQSDDDLKALFARYTYRFHQPWFAGFQATDTNYAVVADNAASEEILDQFGLTGFDSVGVGLVVDYDSRDNVNTPSTGVYADANNIAYREGLGGDVSFDVYRLTIKQYLPHHDRYVFAWKFSNHLTNDAPPSGYASVRLRGYTAGQYLGENMSSLEAEERIKFGERWGMTAFLGVACLYGGGMKCSDSDNVYADIGGGFYYTLKPKDKIAATAELAYGEDGNHGFYMRMGWGF
jgi:hypothetical protein